MISSIISRLVILVFGTLYPAYASYKAVRTKNVKEYVKWMMYWIVFALFTCAETFTDVFCSFWFPFYYEFKVILVLWLLSPATKGSSILYRKFVHPMLTKREQEIDEYISKAKEQGYHTVLTLGTKGVNYATTVIMQTAIKGGGGIVNQLRRSYSLSDINADMDAIAELNRSNGNAEDELDLGDAPMPIDPRLRRAQGYSPRRSTSGSGRVEMYFPEVDVSVRQRGSRPREPGIPFSHIRSTEDVSSGYSSAEMLYPGHPTPAEGQEPLVRTSSVGSSRVTRTKTGRGGVIAKRPIPSTTEETETWIESEDSDSGNQEDSFYDVPATPSSPPVDLLTSALSHLVTSQQIESDMKGHPPVTLPTNPYPKSPYKENMELVSNTDKPYLPTLERHAINLSADKEACKLYEENVVKLASLENINKGDDLTLCHRIEEDTSSNYELSIVDDIKPQTESETLKTEMCETLDMANEEREMVQIFEECLPSSSTKEEPLNQDCEIKETKLGVLKITEKNLEANMQEPTLNVFELNRLTQDAKPDVLDENYTSATEESLNEDDCDFFDTDNNLEEYPSKEIANSSPTLVFLTTVTDGMQQSSDDAHRDSRAGRYNKRPAPSPPPRHDEDIFLQASSHLSDMDVAYPKSAEASPNITKKKLPVDHSIGRYDLKDNSHHPETGGNEFHASRADTNTKHVPPSSPSQPRVDTKVKQDSRFISRLFSKPKNQLTSLFPFLASHEDLPQSPEIMTNSMTSLDGDALNQARMRSSSTTSGVSSTSDLMPPPPELPPRRKSSENTVLNKASNASPRMSHGSPRGGGRICIREMSHSPPRRHNNLD